MFDSYETLNASKNSMLRSVEVFDNKLSIVDENEDQPLFKRMNFMEHMNRMQAAQIEQYKSMQQEMKRLQMTQSKMKEMMRRMDMLESKNVTFCTWKQVDGLIKNTSEQIKADIAGDLK